VSQALSITIDLSQLRARLMPSLATVLLGRLGGMTVVFFVLAQ
jgi:hypothetical protein